MRLSLTQADVQRLMTDPSGEARREAASKVSVTYASEGLSDQERAIAEDILRVLAGDMEVRVREALAENLKAHSGLAHDLAVKLASDVESVALPVIQFSGVLSDDDLELIIQTQGAQKQIAIAQRETVSERISEALVETGNEDVVETLVGNEGAAISNATFSRVLTEFHGSERINNRLVHREALPVEIAERLVSVVSEKLRDELASRHELPESVISLLVVQTREQETLGLLGDDAKTVDIQTLVTQLQSNDRLTPSIILRAVCQGDIEFFEVSLAIRSRLPLGAARSLIYDKGSLGLPAIVERASLPSGMIPLFLAAIDVVSEIEYDGGERDRERCRRRILERILTVMEDPSAQLGEENADYLLERLCSLDVPSTTASWQIRN
jgi:uncharacterized protein (DUF2336 family)